MLDNVLKLIEGPVTDAITKSKEIPVSKKDVAISATTTGIADTLQKSFTPENISMLTGLFTDGSKAASGKNFLTDSITSTIVNILSQKVGISKTAAGSIASAILPPLMKVISTKMSGGSKDGGIDIGSLIEMFSNGKSSKNSGNVFGDVLGSLGKMFSK